MQGASPGVLLQPTPLLDYSTRSIHGTVVPQRRLSVVDKADEVQQYVESAVLQLPIFFVNRNGELGFPLPDIIRGYDYDLRNEDDSAPLGDKITTQIRIGVSLFICQLLIESLPNSFCETTCSGPAICLGSAR